MSTPLDSFDDTLGFMPIDDPNLTPLRRSTRIRTKTRYIADDEASHVDDDALLHLAIQASLQSPSSEADSSLWSRDQLHVPVVAPQQAVVVPVATPRRRGRPPGRKDSTTSSTTKSSNARTRPVASRDSDTDEDDLVVVSVGHTATASPSTRVKPIGGRFTRPNKKAKVAVGLSDTVVIGDAFGSFTIEDARNRKPTASSSFSFPTTSATSSAALSTPTRAHSHPHLAHSPSHGHTHDLSLPLTQQHSSLMLSSLQDSSASLSDAPPSLLMSDTAGATRSGDGQWPYRRADEEYCNGLPRSAYGHQCPSLAYTDASEGEPRVVVYRPQRSRSRTAITATATSDAALVTGTAVPPSVGGSAEAGGMDAAAALEASADVGTMGIAGVDAGTHVSPAHPPDTTIAAEAGAHTDAVAETETEAEAEADEEPLDPRLADPSDCVVVLVVRSNHPRGVKREAPSGGLTRTASARNAQAQISALQPTPAPTEAPGGAAPTARRRPPTTARNNAARASAEGDDSDVEVVGAKEKDYDPNENWPHARYTCGVYPYNAANGTRRERACELCYCHICACPWRACPLWAKHCSARDCDLDNAEKAKMKRARDIVAARNEGNAEWQELTERQRMEHVLYCYRTMPSGKNKTLKGWIVPAKQGGG